MQPPQKGMSKRRAIVLTTCICLTFWIFWNISSLDIALPSVGGVSKATLPSCKHSAENRETLLILRTGATDIADRIPTHISTSLRFFEQHVIFSDYAETFLGERVLDALELVDPDIVANKHDFDLYRRIKQHGRAALAQSELSGNQSQTPSSSGHTEIPGWKLDKWKFVPMVNRTFYEYPDMKWYIFAEGDTFVFWSTLHAYLASIDHMESHYLGSATNIGDNPAFAHGGAGFIVSRPAMRMIADYYSTHKADIESLNQKSWAGDAVLGKVFFDAGVPVKDIWPIVHGESTNQASSARPWSPGVPKEAEQIWCYPAASLHHMSPAAVDGLWHYEQQWLEERVDVSLT